ncbi:MAG: ABC transporter substrate-binding protein, partial [Acidobacteriota bacterium]|nr:ABC transporter substrate-binding protein [Acidobacteriota bacterium]
ITTPAPRPFTVMLAGAPGPQQAALYVALGQGDLRAAGLAVRIEPGDAGAPPTRALAARQADVALASQRELLIARDRGEALVSIATLSSAGDSEPALAVRAADAEHRGEELRAFLHALAIGAYEARQSPGRAAALLLAANPALSGSPRPEANRRPRSAGRRPVRLPRASAGASGGTGAGQAPGTAPGNLERQIVASATPAYGKPYGYQSPAQWASLAAALYAARTLHRDPEKLAPPYTNEFLPGEGL